MNWREYWREFGPWLVLLAWSPKSGEPSETAETAQRFAAEAQPFARLGSTRSAFAAGFAWCVLVVVGGCAALDPAAAPPPALVVEAPMGSVRTLLPAVPPAVSRALVRDSAAVQANARRFVAKPSTPVEKVEGLEPLTRAVNRSQAVMELHRRREGRYRPADVRAARAALDAVAKFMDQQPAPDQLPLEEPSQ